MFGADFSNQLRSAFDFGAWVGSGDASSDASDAATVVGDRAEQVSRDAGGALDGLSESTGNVADAVGSAAETAGNLATASRWIAIAVIVVVGVVALLAVLATVSFLGSRWLSAAPEFLAFVTNLIPTVPS